MLTNRNLMCVFALFLTLVSCSSEPEKKVAVSEPKKFTTPEMPALLTTAEQKADFVATHYWDNFDFADTTLISNSDITEQAFVDFINLLPHFEQPLAQKGIATMISKATVDSSMYAHFIQMSEKYLYDPNSPFRSEEFYILVLREILANPKLDEIHKLRPRYQLELALKNRVGDKALDFEYTKENGTKSRLYRATGDPLLIFFFRPDCPTCKEVKEYIAKNGIDKLVKILYVNPDLDTHLEALYDLRASPTLYLLDGAKKVVMKDASIDQIEQYLLKNKS